MATKNIARTAIEGGRVKSNKHERWQSNREVRNSANQLVRKFRSNPDLFDERPMPDRTPVQKEFADKLAAPARWFAKKANGLAFDDIRGMLLRTFDARGLAGRHLVHDHLMPKRDHVTGHPRTGSYKDRVLCSFDQNEIFRTYDNHEASAKDRSIADNLDLYRERLKAQRVFKRLKPSSDWWVAWHKHEYVWMKFTGRIVNAACHHSWCRKKTKWHYTDGSVRFHPHLTALVNGAVVPSHKEWETAIIRPLSIEEETRFMRLPHRYDRQEFMRKPYRPAP